MPLNDVYNALDRHLSGGVIDLWAAAESEPALSGLIDALGAFAISAGFALRNARLTRLDSAVQLRGDGTFGLGPAADRPPMVATLEVTLSAQLDYQLGFDFGPARVGFDTLFTDLLPPYQQIDEATQTVSTVPSFLDDLGVRSLNLIGRNDGSNAVVADGLLDPEGILLKYQRLLPGWPLRLDGTIEMPRHADDVVAMELNGIDKRVQIPFFNNTLDDVGFALRSVRDLDPTIDQVAALSALELIGSLRFGSNLPVRLRVPMTASGDTWRLIADLQPDQGRIGDAIVALAGLLGLNPDQLEQPIDFLDLNRFFLSEVEVAFEPPSGALPLVDIAQNAAVAAFTPNLRWLAITVESTGTWDPPIPFVNIDEVGARWQVSWPLGASDTVSSGSVFGGLIIGDSNEIHALTGEAEPFVLDVTAYLPSFVVTGNLRQELTLPIGTALAKFIGPGTPKTPPGMSLTRFSFTADPLSRTFRADAAIDMDWRLSPFSNVVFDLVGLSFFVDVSQPRVAGGIAASIRLDDKPAANGLIPTVTVAAMAERAQGQTRWTFAGGLLPGAPLSLTRIAKRLMDVDASGWPNFPEISIDTLEFTVQTGDAGFYSASGSASLLWSPQILDTEVRIAVTAGASVTKPAGGSASGIVNGSFALNQLAMSVAFEFGVPNPTWRFRVQFGEPYIELTTFTTTDTPAQRILTAQLGGVTLGSIIEYLANLAAPTMGYRLDSPWDSLNKVDLSRFLVSLNLSKSSVEVSTKLPIDLGPIKITQLGLKYTRGAGLSGVELTLAGSFFGQDRTGDKALGWDVIRDPPPAVPGQGGALVDLHYLALGQRVRPEDDSSKTVRQYLDTMQKAMQPLPPGSDSPPPIGNGVVFAADSEWLIGLDIDLAQTFRLGLLFNDPRLYGLSIALRGPKAGSFTGLDFQLLYKKISDNVGMFRIDLALPLPMRSYTFGSVSITLGTIALEVYTNGNFTVDLGYPWKRDFSRAFTLQYFPFIGRGGIYFGYLNGETSSRVPKITDGTFDPVIELGLGLAVGVGKEVVFGPLSGGAYVQIEVVFFGVFGWFNPSDQGREPAVYFWAQATAAIVGKVYGKVDFKVIKVSVTLMAEAEARVTFEVYREALFEIAVRVTAEAEVKVLFIKISFSFKVRLDLAFSAGSNQATPWRLASDQGAHRSLRQRGNRLPALQRSSQRRISALAQTQGRLNAAAGLLRGSADYWLNFDPQAPVFPGGQRTLALNLIPAFTLTDLAVSWTGAVPANADPAYRIALMLSAETGVDPQARTPQMRANRSVDCCVHAQNPSDQPAHLLAEALLRWAIFAVVSSDVMANPSAELVSAAQLAQLSDQLDMPAAADQSFALSNLGAFFTHSLKWQIAGDPGGDPTVVDAMLLPLPPLLQFTWDKPEAGARVLSTWQLIGDGYLADVAAYQERFQPLSTDPEQEGERSADEETLESFASHAFRDFCLMLTKAAVKAARDQLLRAEVVITAPSSLASIAARFPTTTVDYRVQGGDTLDQVGLAIGATIEELRAFNPNLESALANAVPGSLLTVVIGVAAALVALDNPDTLLSAGTYALGSLTANVRLGDSFTAIAARFGLTKVGELGTIANLGDLRLLDPLAEVDSAAARYQFAVDVRDGLGAAVFFVRWFGIGEIAEADWYAQTIALWNATALAGVDPDGTIPAGVALKVPTAYNDSAVPPPSANYTTLAGDTPLRIGGALALTQIYATDGGPPAWPAFRIAVAQTGRSIELPAIKIPLQAGESAHSLGMRSLLHTVGNEVDAGALLKWLGESPILSPLALIEVPGATINTADHTSFGAISSALALPIVQIGSVLADVANLLAASEQDPITLSISAVPVQRIDSLVADTLAGTTVADLAGQVSRQTLSGLRLPAPQPSADGAVNATGPLSAFVDLTGQQIVGPPPGDSVEPGSGISLNVERTGTVPWIEFVNSVTSAGETLGLLRQRHPDVESLNAGIAIGTARNQPVAAGIIVRTAMSDSLTYSYSAADLKTRYPQPSLQLQPILAPEALALSALAPESFGLDQDVVLQTAQRLTLPGDQSAVNGQPQMYPFPNDLRVLAHAGTEGRFEVVASRPGDSAAGHSQIMPDATFAAVVQIQISRDPEHSGVYGLTGSDVDGREVLLDLVAHLGDGAVAYLAVQPDPAAADSDGLTVLDLASPSDAFLVRTNLSTASVPGGVERAAAALLARKKSVTAALDGSDIGSPVDFAQLLFEGSVVGGAGYFLAVTTRDGAMLPASAFDSDGRAQLSLIVLSATAQQPAPGGRQLEPFVNATMLAAGLDTNSQPLSVIACDDSLGSTVATVPPGNAGFRVVLPNPRQSSALAAADSSLTAQLFGLIDYKLGSAGSAFHADVAGLPIYPRSAADDTWRVERAERRRMLRGQARAAVDPTPPWHFDIILPINRFAGPSAAPAVFGLPPADLDPYRGLGTASTRPDADFAVGLRDVFGNVSSEASASKLSASIGYTDPLLGPDAWPATRLSYAVSGDDPDAVLTAKIEVLPANLWPALSEDPTAALPRARQQSERYAEIYFQWAQPGLQVGLGTSLRGTAAQVPLANGPVDFWATAAAQGLMAKALAQAVPERPVAAGAQSLAGLVDRYGFELDQFAVANGDQPAHAVLQSEAVPMPAYAVVQEGDSAEDLVARAPDGVLAPTPEALLNFAANSRRLPLRPGTVLITDARSATLPGNQPTSALSTLADELGTTVGQLALDNADAEVLRAGFRFDLDGVELVVNYLPDEGVLVRSLTEAVSAYSTTGVHVAVDQLGEQVRDETSLLSINSEITSRHYQVPAATADQPFETLSENASGTSPTRLAKLNTRSVDLFDSGAMAYVGDYEQRPSVPADDSATLSEWTQRFGTTPTQLLQRMAEAGVDLPQASALMVPGMLSLPPISDLRIGARMPTNADPAQWVLGFDYGIDPGAALTRLVSDNLSMPRLLNADVAVNVAYDGTQYKENTQAADTLETVLQRFQKQNPRIEDSDLAGGIAANSGLFVSAALVVVPPVLLVAKASSAALAKRYSLAIEALAAANIGMRDALLAGAVLAAPEDPTQTVTLRQSDSWNAVLARFAERGLEVDLGPLVATNQDVEVYRQGARLLLPPRALSYQAPLSQSTYAEPIFALEVVLSSRRPSALIDPDFADSHVQQVRSVLQPATGSSEDDERLALATALRAALPNLRLSSGRVADNDADLWMVNFGADGIAKLEVAPGAPAPTDANWPRFYALRPLYSALVSRSGVALPIVQEDGRIKDSDRTSDFVGIDVETWARRYLADLDRLLAGQTAIELYRDPKARPALVRALEAKRLLVAGPRQGGETAAGTGVAAGLAPVLSLQSQASSEARASAQKTLAQALGVSLSKAYDSAGVVQYDTTVASYWTANPDAPKARLYADAHPEPAPANTLAYTLSSARIDLAATSGTMEVILGLDRPAEHKAIAFAPTLVPTHLEWNIRDLPLQGNTGYVSSTWLTLIPALTAATRPAAVHIDMGSSQAPIPLRAFPSLPSVNGQSADASYPGTAQLAQMGCWTYGFSYRHEHAAQDELIVNLRFNLSENDARAVLAADDDVATCLARYQAVADQLFGLTQGLGSAEGGDTSANAANSLSDLIHATAVAWSGHFASLDARRHLRAEVAHCSYWLNLQLIRSADGKELEAIDVTRIADPDQPGSTPTSAGPDDRWPELRYCAPDGSQRSLTGAIVEPGSMTRRYQFDGEPISTAQWAQVELRYADLLVAHWQNATGSVSVLRNRNLIANASTEPAFVYASARVQAAEIITPLLRWTTAVEIGNGSTPIPGLVKALESLFGSAPDGEPVALSIGYGFELAAGTSPTNALRTVLPVHLLPRSRWSAELAAKLTQAIETWQRSNQPSTDGALYAFGITLYSTQAAVTTPPLLAVEGMIYRLG